MNCQASEFAHTQGSSLHPASSSICTSAILDGVLSPSGGDILITAVGPVELYTGAAYNGTSLLLMRQRPGKWQSASGIESLDFASSPEKQQYSYHMYLVDTIDFINARCKGAEASLADCEAEKPPATCLEHNDDVVIKCTNNVAGVEPGAGTVRIVGPTGTPPQNGIGRLQLYNNGREAALNQCPHLVSDDVYCVHEEDVVVACEGDGDPSGIGAFRREEAVAQKIRPLTSWHLTCFDTLETKTGLGGPPGATYHVVCPPNCGPHGPKAGTPLTLPTPAGGVHTATSPSMQLAPASAQSNQAGALSVPAAGLNAPSGAAQVVPPATGHSHAVTSSNPTAHSSTVGLLMSNKEALLPQQRKERSRISKPRAIMALPSGHAGDPTSPTAKLLEAPAGVVSSVVEVKSQGSHPASSAGFHGKPSDFIDVSSLAEGSVTSSIRDFTVAVKAAVTEADYFEGDILGVKLYNQEVQAPTIQSAFSPASLAAHIPQAPSETRRTDDGRLCLSACSLQIPAGAGAPVRPTKPAISLSCVDSLRRPEFNNFTGQKILAVCPPDCLHVNAPLEGCKVFTPRSSICKAGLHAGAVPKEGGELVVTLVAGLTSYEASQGHFGSESFGVMSDSSGAYIRSFVFATANLRQQPALNSQPVASAGFNRPVLPHLLD
ncbi:hypothetical protein Emag_004020 [Eimeria magna]